MWHFLKHLSLVHFNLESINSHVSEQQIPPIANFPVKITLEGRKYYGKLICVNAQRLGIIN